MYKGTKMHVHLLRIFCTFWENPPWFFLVGERYKIISDTVSFLEKIDTEFSQILQDVKYSQLVHIIRKIWKLIFKYEIIFSSTSFIIYFSTIKLKVDYTIMTGLQDVFSKSPRNSGKQIFIDSSNNSKVISSSLTQTGYTDLVTVLIAYIAKTA